MEALRRWTPFPAILLSHGSGGPGPMQTSGMTMKKAAETGTATQELPPEDLPPAVGKTPDEGPNLLYNSIPVWEGDVFKFLDDNVRRGACEIWTIGHLSHRDWAH